MAKRNTDIKKLQEEIDKLNLQAWNDRITNSNQSVAVSKKTVKLSREINYKKGLAEGLRTLGECYSRISKNDEAIKALTESLSLFKGLKDLSGQNRILISLGVVRRNRGDLSGSVQLLLKAFDLNDRFKDRDSEAAISYHLGVTYKHLGNFEKALEYLYRALLLARQLNNKVYESYPIHIIGSIYFENGDHKKALEYFLEAHALRKQTGDKFGEAGSLDNIGFTYFKLKDYSRAIKFCKQSLAISNSTNDKKGQANALFHLAEIYRRTNKLKQAAEYSDKSLKIRKASGDKKGEVEILLFLANLTAVQSKNKNDKTILEFLSAALRITKELKALDLLSKVHFQLYEFYKQNESSDKAIKHLVLHDKLEKELHKNSINQKVLNLEISHKAEEAKKETDEIRSKNEELKKLNEEIENKNRELEIETALERVRARTMAMQKSEELPETTFLLFQQLKELGQEAAQLSLGIIKEEEGYAELSATVHGKTITQTHKVPLDEPYVMKKAVKAWKGKKQSTIIRIKGKELKEYNAWRNKVLKKKIIFPEKQWIVNVIFFSKGLLSFSSEKEISKETFQLLERFAAVFDLTYTRFLDLKRAEGQAREAEIELALERVRAKTMAMQKSDELKETTLVLFQQFKALGATTAQVSICIFDEGITKGEMFVTLKGEKIDRSFPMDLDEESFVMKRAKKAFLNDQKTFSVTITGKELQNYNHWRNLLIGKKGWDESVAVRKQSWYVNAVFFSRGMMGISSDSPPSDEAIKLLERFGNVFDVTYTRFNDLKKAEAQAKESQIQLALERVRARTMAMQRSNELMETASVLFNQLNQLGENIERTIIGVMNEEERVVEAWATRPDGSQMEKMQKFPIDEPIVLRKVYVAWRQQKKSIVIDLRDEELESYFQFLKARSSRMKRESFGERRVESFAFFSKGFLGVINADPKTPANVELYERFAAVFDQTYTRFLDLQKAEAQAREAQIELSLERVRAKAMAMQKSIDVNAAVAIVFEELEKLNLGMLRCGIAINHKENRTAEVWTTSVNDKGVVLQTSGDESVDIHPLLQIAFEGWLQQRETDYELKGNDLINYYRSLKATNFHLNEDSEIIAKAQTQGNEQPLRQFNHNVPFEAGTLFAFRETEFPDEAKKIMRRFASVFNLTYKRFLDLQKAEAQAREAQIEAALERVRSRTMAMHKSDELVEVIQMVFEQLQHLNFNIDTASFSLNYKNYPFNVWMAAPNQPYPAQIEIPSADISIMNRIKQAIAEGNDFFAQTFDHEEKNQWLLHVFEHTIIKHATTERKKFMLDAAGISISIVLLKQISLIIGNYTAIPYTDEENVILKRFANVFEQTYTRFLDLQKAEAQAREAKIEAALERVRSKTMAMQRSEELDSVIKTVYSELKHLDVSFYRCFIMIFDEQKGATWWMGSPDDDLFHEGFYVQYHTHLPHLAYLKGWEQRRQKWEYRLAGQIKKDWDEFIFSQTTLSKLPPIVIQDMKSFEFAHLSASFENFGCITTGGVEGLSEKSFDILSRFAKVFDQTYTRFNDLKNAEAQARESRIQLALERVRARTMAMQRSEDLMDAASLLFKQIAELGTKSWSSGFIIFQPEDNTINSWMSKPDGSIGVAFNIPHTEDPFFIKIYDAYKKGEEFFVMESGGKELAETYRYMFSLPGAAKALGAIEEIGFQMPTFQITHCAFFTQGFLMFITYQACREMWDIFKRFGKVFEQTYTRFLDLQKAEAQAREAQIEASLERVRARTMAMHSSEDVSLAIATLFTELDKLGIENVRCGIAIVHENKTMEVWSVTNVDNGKTVKAAGNFDMNAHKLWQRFFEAWKNRSSFLHYYLAGKEKQDYINILNNAPNYLSQPIEDMPDMDFQSYHFNEGAIWTFSMKPHMVEEQQVMKRFSAVFSLTFRRYQDLRKAEAQAREAKIEASLERVRSKTMAMHNSQDVADTVSTLFDELKKLGIETYRCGIGIMHDTKPMELWTARSGADMIIGHLDMTIHPLLQGAVRGWKNKHDSFSYDLKGSDLIQYYKVLNEQPSYPVKYDLSSLPPQLFHNDFYFNEGTLFVFSLEQLSTEASAILKRFAAVFGQTYRRYLDLQKAEAQTRESQIQLALERIRARTMAMQRSDELSETAAVLFEQLKQVGEKPERAFIGVVNEEEHVIEIWATHHGGIQLNMAVKLTIDEPTVMHKSYVAWKEQKKSIVIDLQGEELESYFQFLKKEGAPVNREIFGDRRLENIAFFSKGMLGVITPDPQTEESIQLYERFASVFDLTYTRFLDLKKAEASAREATIEVSLERVRGSALAMHNSNDISSTTTIVFEELKKINIRSKRCGVILISKDSYTGNIYAAATSADGKFLTIRRTIDMTLHQSLRQQYESWKEQKNYFVEMKGDELRSYHQLPFFHSSPDYIPSTNYDQAEYGYYISFSEGLFYAWTEIPYSNDEINILNRFNRIVDLTFRRYFDLQKSEASAKEAVKQAALDRIRADIASMRSVADLNRITPLIWNELTILGIPFIRCGVFIMDNEQKIMHTFLSTPEGKAIAAFHLPYDTPGNVQQILSHWQKKEKYLDHWDETAFIAFADTLVKQGALTSPEDYLKTLPKGGFYLHFLPFLQGMLYVGNTDKLNDEHIELLQHVADAFSTAYARYEDFNKLEAAKKQVDSTLTELQTTQKQLIQSEKMASLGELTAGIAHEIQNPLNFVNNFSEVSNELIDEMNAEIEKGDMEEAKAISNDIKQNLEKINHHGKRADAIVKSMLQHSRTSSGKKEPTDINALADEYLRLSYHGLRAKDKSFNAKFEMDLDKSIGKINIIGQDIGRVILNLINNAFYAVNEKKKQVGDEYEPTVTVSTKQSNGTVEIKVRDNGNGIPQKVLDKIFQPFFTTKPTGQGTGLGLSLSYDIITKGHGGDLRVETKEGEGSEFIIQLPGN